MAEFKRALAVGVAGLLLSSAAIWWRFRHDRHDHDTMEWGWIAALGVLGALRLSGHLLPGTAFGVGLLLVGGAVAQRFHLDAVPHLFVLLPGAVVTAGTPALEPILPGWAVPAITVMIAIAGWGGSRLDRVPVLRGVAPLIYAVSALGTYAAVPNTDFAVVLCATLLPLSLLALSGRTIAVGGAGAAGLAGCFGVVAAVGGYGRPSALIGGLACIGIVPLAPVLIRGVRRVQARSLRVQGSVLAAHLLLVWWAARVAGHQPFARRAFTVWLLGEAAVVALVTVTGARRPMSPSV